METVLISEEQMKAIQAVLEEIKVHVKKITVPNEAFIDNKQFTKLMGISFRTAQIWRNEKKIGFSQEGKKIYYRLSDIEKFLDDHHQRPAVIKKRIEELKS